MRREMLIAIVGGGLIAGVIDIGAAALITTHNPLVIMRFIAGGLLGKPALKGGAQAAVLGFALQLVMSVVIAAVYGLVSLKAPALVRWWWAGGLVYGVGVFVVMNYVVVPLSAWRRLPSFTPLSFAENMAAMLVFGVIIAFATYWGARTPPV